MNMRQVICLRTVILCRMKDRRMILKEVKERSGLDGENIFRMLVPIIKVGGIIGRKGEFIKKITEETKAQIKILDGLPGTSERAVSFFSLYLFLVGFIPMYAYCIFFLLCRSWLSKLSIN
jgi:hypothetical protein